MIRCASALEGLRELPAGSVDFLTPKDAAV